MFAVRTLRRSGAAIAAAMTIATLGAMPAYAGKPAPAPKNLAATVDAHPNGSYDVAATWDTVANATSYRAILSKGGTTLASATVSTTSWSPHVVTTPGNVTVSVRGVIGKKPGRTAALTVPLPDVVAPTGAFHATWENNTQIATISITTPVADNSGGAVTATVNWDSENSSATEPWDLSSDITHTYPAGAGRYVPVVTLTDSSSNHNSVDVPVNAVVIMDDEAPTGTFANDTTTAWAAFTRVTVSQSDIDDNWTPAALIKRSVAWGDGTTTNWTGGDPATHVYAVAGSFTPVVTLTDEAGNEAPESTTEVVVTADTNGPKVKLTVPKAKHSVKAWKTLRGKATDAETGVKNVWLKAVEKRGGAWYGYNSVTHAWVKAATKTKAFKKAKAFTRPTNAQHQWTAKLAKLRKGTLVYKVRATDKVGNRSKTLSHTATLTKR